MGLPTAERHLALCGRGEGTTAVVSLQQGLAVVEQHVFPHHVQQAVVVTAGGARVLVAARTHRGDTHARLEEHNDPKKKKEKKHIIR